MSKLNSTRGQWNGDCSINWSFGASYRWKLVEIYKIPFRTFLRECAEYPSLEGLAS